MRIRRRPLIAAAVFFVPVVAFLAALATSASAARSNETVAPSSLAFADRAGDASVAPDITKVAITGNGGNGKIVFTVSVSGLWPATPDGLYRDVNLWLDTDNDRTTGSPSGNEYWMYAFSDPYDADHWWGTARWTGSAWEYVPWVPTEYFRRDEGFVTWGVTASDLGTRSFAVYATARTYDLTLDRMIARDFAPDSGDWLYDIGGPTKSIASFLVPVIGQPVTTPTRPTAGRRVTVSFLVSRTDQGRSQPLVGGTMACAPSVDGKVLRHAESFAAGVARLSFVVPKSAQGKRLKVKVTIKAPSYEEEGVWVNVFTGQSGVLRREYIGRSTTKVVSFLVRAA